MKIGDFFKELHRRNVWKVAVGYTAIAIALLQRMRLEPEETGEGNQ